MNGPDHGPDRASSQSGLRLVDNIIQFVRLLRKAGLKVGPASAANAVDAVQLIDIGERSQLYHALAACLIKRPEDRDLFDQAFEIFWQNPQWLQRVRGMLLPEIEMPKEADDDEDPVLRRLQEALSDQAESPDADLEPAAEKIEIDATLTFSSQEVFRAMDFQMMSATELREAEKAVDAIDLPLLMRPSHRFRPTSTGAVISFRRTLQQMARHAGFCLPVRQSRQQRQRPLVVICDISGSMDRYSRIFLRFVHALTSRRQRVHSFLFGTRLTNISHFMRDRDVDVALRRIADHVEDWSGGTRIGTAIRTFNRDWSRRVLGQGAVVLLITDGLDRDGAEGLAPEIERLQKSCAKLIWLNPLLRFDGFEPKSQTIQQILPHVDAFLPLHSLDSMEELSAVIGQQLTGQWRHHAMPHWMQRLRVAQQVTAGG
jgi:uncharacterized protein with von Willebrand factor type A (vWA) domain